MGLILSIIDNHRLLIGKWIFLYFSIFKKFYWICDEFNWFSL